MLFAGDTPIKGEGSKPITIDTTFKPREKRPVEDHTKKIQKKSDERLAALGEKGREPWVQKKDGKDQKALVDSGKQLEKMTASRQPTGFKSITARQPDLTAGATTASAELMVDESLSIRDVLAEMEKVEPEKAERNFMADLKAAMPKGGKEVIEGPSKPLEVAEKGELKERKVGNESAPKKEVAAKTPEPTFDWIKEIGDKAGQRSLDNLPDFGLPSDIDYGKAGSGGPFDLTEIDTEEAPKLTYAERGYKKPKPQRFETRGVIKDVAKKEEPKFVPKIGTPLDFVKSQIKPQEPQKPQKPIVGPREELKVARGKLKETRISFVDPLTTRRFEEDLRLRMKNEPAREELDRRILGGIEKGEATLEKAKEDASMATLSFDNVKVYAYAAFRSEADLKNFRRMVLSCGHKGKFIVVQINPKVWGVYTKPQFDAIKKGFEADGVFNDMKIFVI